MIATPDLIRRMTQSAVISRYANQQTLGEVLAGVYRPSVGSILPGWRTGSNRRAAWDRAVAKTQTEGPRVLNERIASGIGRITWANADTGAEDPAVNEMLNEIGMRDLARSLAEDYIANGIAVALAYRDADTNEPRIDRLSGMVEPYTDPLNRDRITGLYRTVSYLTDAGLLRWRTEVYDWEDSPPGRAVHRYWSNLEKPTDLGHDPDEFPDGPRPVYRIDRMTDDGLPVGQLETALPIMLGLYATELMLATTEEVSAYPMLKVRGSTRNVKSVGVAEVIGVDLDGDAEWMQPGSLAELERRRAIKREAVREASFLYAGTLGTETPSGEALIQANRVPAQADRNVAEAVSELTTEAAQAYAVLADGRPPVVTVEPDRGYEQRQRVAVLETLDDIGAVPPSVKARIAQVVLGDAYTDAELDEWIEEQKRPTLRLRPGEPA